VLHSDGYCLSTASTNKELAWAFTEFALGPAGQSQLAKTGRTVPSLKAVAESPAFLSSLAPPASSQIYLDMAPYIQRVPIATTWLEVEEALDNEIERAFYGEVSVEAAARQAVDLTSEYFAQNLKDLQAP
jgi:multiple sugar transport system substrate-binding protein